MSYERPFAPDMLPGLVTWLDTVHLGAAMPARRVLTDSLYPVGGVELGSHVADTGQAWYANRNGGTHLYSDLAPYSVDVTYGPPMTAHVAFDPGNNEGTWTIDAGVSDLRMGIYVGDAEAGLRLCWRVSNDPGMFPTHFEWNPVTGTVLFGTYGASSPVNHWVKPLVTPSVVHTKRCEVECVGPDHYLYVDGKLVGHFQDDANMGYTRVGFDIAGPAYMDGPLTVDAVAIPAAALMDGSPVSIWPDVMRRHADTGHQGYGDYHPTPAAYRTRNDNILDYREATGQTGWSGVGYDVAHPGGSVVLTQNVDGSPVHAVGSHVPTENVSGLFVGCVRARLVGGASRAVYADLNTFQGYPTPRGSYQGPNVYQTPVDGMWRNYWVAGGMNPPLTDLQVGLTVGGQHTGEGVEIQHSFLSRFDADAPRRNIGTLTKASEWSGQYGGTFNPSDQLDPDGFPTVVSTTRDPAPMTPIIPMPGAGCYLVEIWSLPGVPGGQVRLQAMSYDGNAGVINTDYSADTEGSDWQKVRLLFIIPEAPETDGVDGIRFFFRHPFDPDPSSPFRLYSTNVKLYKVEATDPVDVSEGPVVDSYTNQMVLPLPHLPRPFTVAGRFLHRHVGAGQGAVQVLQVQSDAPPFNPIMSYDGEWRFFDGGNSANNGPDDTWTTYVVEMGATHVKTWVNGALLDTAAGGKNQLAGPGFFGGIPMRKFVAYDRALTDPERVALEAFMATPAPLP